MLYYLTKPFAKITLGIYFRKIYISHRERIPDDKPVLLAANHPTAFIEPCILACWLDEPLHFIARGDLYQNNFFLRKLYDWYHMTPVFRLEDAGFGSLKNNYRSFERCFDTLKKKEPLMILAEGRTIHEKRLRPVMKGTARIVFGALEKYGDLDIQVIPVGVNYSNPDDFRSLAMIDFGEPIAVTEYTRLYRKNPPKAINEFTGELERRLKERVIHVEDPADDALVESLLEIYQNDLKTKVLPVLSTDPSVLIEQKRIADFINALHGEGKVFLSKLVDTYFSNLGSHKVSDLGLVNRDYSGLGHLIPAFGGWMPSALGWFLNFLPVWAGSSIAAKIAPSIEFRASTAIVFSAFLYLFYLVGIGGILYAKWGIWASLFVFLIPLLGYFHIWYRGFYQKWEEARKAGRLSEAYVEELMKLRMDIRHSVWEGVGSRE